LFSLLAVAAIIGCGGGGGSSSSGGSVTYSNLQVEYMSSYQSSISVDPTQLTAGDSIWLEATATANDGFSTYPVVLTPTNYQVSGGSSVGTVSVNGVLTVNTSTTGAYTVTAQSPAGSLKWTFDVVPPPSTPVVKGTVLVSGGSGVAGVIVTAYDANANAVGSATTDASGNFSLATTSAAVHFQVSLQNVDPTFATYYNDYGYGNNSFAFVTPQCLPSLPALTGGNHDYPLTYNVTLFPKTSPPPSPPACLN
jgi:hypothetical protein